MTIDRKVTGKAASIPAGLSAGVLMAMAALLAGTWITALLIHREILPWNQTGYAVMVLLILSSWIGTAAAAGKVKRRRAWICAATGGIFFVTLLAVTGLFFGGTYSGVGETALLIFCGSMLGFFVKSPANTNGSRRKRRRYHG